MVDIHCHILPGVDDGSGNWNDSIEMAQLAAASGIQSIVVTPHCNMPGVFQNHWNTQMQKMVDRLQEEVLAKNIPVTFFPGQEIFLASGFLPLIKAGKLIPINHSRYFLVEFHPRENTVVALRKLQQMLAEVHIN